MSKIAALAGKKDDEEQFNVSTVMTTQYTNSLRLLSDFEFKSTASSFIQTWQNNALASDDTGVEFFYEESGTNGLVYNLYADMMLGLNFVPSRVYDILTTNYNNLASEYPRLPYSISALQCFVQGKQAQFMGFL